MINAAVIGLGWWGRTMVEAVQGTSSLLRFTHGVTLEPAAAAPFAATHHLQVTDDYTAVLRDPDVDAVVLATPHSLHVDQITAAARAGKHVYCEKPLALTLDGATAAVQASRSHGVVLAVGHDKRFLPAVTAAADLAATGSLGSLLHLEAQYSNPYSSSNVSGAWRHSETEAPGGGLSGPGLHALDAVVWLAGPIERVHAQLARWKPPPQPVDAVSVLVRFTGGATAAVSSVRAVPDYFRLQVVGTDGWVEVRDFGTVVHTPLHGQPEITTFAQHEVAVGFLLDRFAEAATGGRAFPVTLESSLDTVQAFEAAATSLREERTITVSPRSRLEREEAR